MEADNTLHGSPLTSELRRYQSMLFPFAYNIIGEVMEAQDVVQEVLNHYFLANTTHIEKASSYLIRSVINRAINQKNLLRNRMEVYPGAWLPAPVITEDRVYARADQDKILHYSLLVLLEQLNPKERAVFILKETFDFTHEEIADILNINKDHSRQLLKRSKEKISPLPRGKANSRRADQLLTKLVEAISAADIETTKRLLTEDVQSVSDGGPHARAARKILTGPERVSKFLRAIYGKYYPAGASAQFVTVNHHPALLFRLNDVIFRCIVFQVRAGKIQRLFIIVNPDKLRAL